MLHRVISSGTKGLKRNLTLGVQPLIVHNFLTSSLNDFKFGIFFFFFCRIKTNMYVFDLQFTDIFLPVLQMLTFCYLKKSQSNDVNNFINCFVFHILLIACMSLSLLILNLEKYS